MFFHLPLLALLLLAIAADLTDTIEAIFGSFINTKESRMC
jgi:hypothetical protein